MGAAAGLLGSLAAIALALIAFLPLLEDIATVPLVGMLSLTVILVTLVAHRRLPGNFPGALAAVVIGVVAYLSFDELGKLLGWSIVPSLKHAGHSALQMPHLMPFPRRRTRGLAMVVDGAGELHWRSCPWPCLLPWPPS